MNGGGAPDRPRVIELWAARIALVLLAVLLIANVRRWVINMESAPHRLRPYFWGDASLGERMGQRRFGCSYVLEERLAGSTVVTPPAFHGARWFMEHVGQVSIEPTSKARTLDPDQSLVISSIELAETVCSKRPLLMLIDGVGRYEIVKKGSGAEARWVALPAPLLAELHDEDRRAKAPLTQSCSLLASSLWSVDDPQRARIAAGPALTIDKAQRGDTVYAMTGGIRGGFSSEPEAQPCRASPPGGLLIRAELTREGPIRPSLYVIQYGATGRLTHESLPLDGSRHQQLIPIHPEATSIRYAVRLAGRGRVEFHELDVVTARPEWRQRFSRRRR